MNTSPVLPFEDSRRLTGPNLFFATSGAVLDVLDETIDTPLLDAWRDRTERATAQLSWSPRQFVARRHAGGVSLAIQAPVDQLFVATEINEWAVCAALAEREPERGSALQAALVAAFNEAVGDGQTPDSNLAPVIAETAALTRFKKLAAREANSPLRALLRGAAERSLPYVLDESQLTLGTGAGARSFQLTALPDITDVAWSDLHAVPTALVSGSNGKTTTVRLIAACARAHGWHTGYNCTDGVFIDAVALTGGDYSGPAGARLVLREPRTEAAVLETARGGILRRGIAVSHADTAVITNISPDHFGEYGVDDLADLAAVKLTIAGVVAPHGLVVLNADDPQLTTQASGLALRFGRRPPLGWFALDADHVVLRAHRKLGGPTCGTRAGRLILNHDGEFDLGATSGMPLSLTNLAAYNIANLAGAALAAAALGVDASTIAEVFARFGAGNDDNPGRMMRFDLNGARALIDYAHNPDGLRGLLTIADRLRGTGGRLGMLLGQAGNRTDDDIRELARVAAEFHPELIVIKENASQLRGRAVGEVPTILRRELLRHGIAESSLPVCPSELDAARLALSWARPGDALALPLHSSSERAAVVALLEGQS